jgi:hypothetical protein
MLRATVARVARPQKFTVCTSKYAPAWYCDSSNKQESLSASGVVSVPGNVSLLVAVSRRRDGGIQILIGVLNGYLPANFPAPLRSGERGSRADCGIGIWSQNTVNTGDFSTQSLGLGHLV